MSNRRIIEVVFQGVLGRSADNDALEWWASKLEAGHTVLDVIATLEASPEALMRQNGALSKRGRSIDEQALSVLLESGDDDLIILDVGAQSLSNEAHIYQPLIDQNLVAQVIGFEPLEDKAAERGSTDPLTTMHAVALGSGDDQTLHINNFDATSSLYPLNEDLTGVVQGLEHLKTVDTTKVRTSRLDDIETPCCIDLMKLDVQGYELEVLKGAVNTLKRSLVVYSEIEYQEIYRGQPLFSEVFNFLRDNGFEFHAVINEQRLSTKYAKAALPSAPATKMFWADAVFFRMPDDLQADRLVRQALISHHLFRWYDQAFELLRRYDLIEGSQLASRYARIWTDASS